MRKIFLTLGALVAATTAWAHIPSPMDEMEKLTRIQETATIIAYGDKCAANLNEDAMVSDLIAALGEGATEFFDNVDNFVVMAGDEELSSLQLKLKCAALRQTLDQRGWSN